MPESKKNILIIAESIDVDDSSGSKANVALIKNLDKAGYEVLVYHYTQKDIQLENIPCISINENRRSLLFLLSRTERYLRYWFKLPLYKYIERVFGFSFTLFNDRNSIVSALKNIQDFKSDIVLTLSKGGSYRPHHALLKLPHWHLKWIAYVHDPYPFACYPRPYDWVEPGYQQKRNFFLNVAGKSRKVAFPSKLLAELMESYYPPLQGKSIIIPHQLIKDEINSTVLPNYFKEDAFTIVHAGVLLGPRNPQGLIKAFQDFLLQHPEAKDQSQLLFLGRKSKYSEEFKRIKEELPQFYSSDAYITFSTVLAIQNRAAVNVILEAKSSISPFLPGKFPHCVMANKPVLLLGPYYSESRRLFGDQYENWAEIDDIPKITKIIERLFRDWLHDKNTSLNRKDIENYLSFSYLKEVIDSLSIN